MIAVIQDLLRQFAAKPTPRIERALRDHLLGFKEIRNVIGEAVFAGRVPPNKRPAIAVKLRRVTTSRYNDLAGEPDMTQTVVQVDVMSRSVGADSHVSKVAEMVRLATSARCYRGYMGKAPNTLYVHSSVIERDAMELPTSPVDANNGWQFQLSSDLRFVHEQL